MRACFPAFSQQAQGNVIRIGPYKLDSQVVLAPMAGITDHPFRTLCRQQGAALTPAEMLSSDPSLWHSEKSRLRRFHAGEQGPRIVQIAGSDPGQMAQAARLNVKHGAQIIDINMGCPAKKVLKKAAGSALLRDEKLVRDILQTVVDAVDVPVTLKMRTGWSPKQRNGLSIARMAEDLGIQSLAVHGRTRECMFKGKVEYDTIAAIKEAVSIPVFANGDIDSPHKALQVLQDTAADGVMIGRAAQGRPWLLRQIRHLLQDGQKLADPTLQEQFKIIITHLQKLYTFYGEYKGTMIARKHVAWYCHRLPAAKPFRTEFNSLQTAAAQLSLLQTHFYQLQECEVAETENPQDIAA
jgi:tRNA-dihydrouridine synthase B